jgi:Ser/Thr protein kinase RdoA (MazF antagonist)
MEFIDGDILNPLEEKAAIHKVAGVMAHLASLKGDHPGPLSRAYCRGLLFPDMEDLQFDNVDDLESWFNTRIRRDDCTIHLRECELILCHLDVAPCNIFWQRDGSICLLNWASAGYYPRLFEFASQWIIEGLDHNFNRLLLEAMDPLPDHEMCQKGSLM